MVPFFGMAIGGKNRQKNHNPRCAFSLWKFGIAIGGNAIAIGGKNVKIEKFDMAIGGKT